MLIKHHLKGLILLFVDLGGIGLTLVLHAAFSSPFWFILVFSLLLLMLLYDIKRHFAFIRHLLLQEERKLRKKSSAGKH